MIGTFSEKRKDGGSSFKALHDYMLYEVDRETGEVIERGEVVTTDNILTPETAAKEMKMVARMSYRTKDPVLHYILSWPASEKPTSEQQKECFRRTLKALGLDGHQAIAIGHGDTDNFHLHIMANRVHPETYKAHAPEWAQYSLHEECRYLEREFGWSEDRGLYRWDEMKGRPVKTEAALLEQWQREREFKGKTATGKGDKMETFGDEETLQSYCRAKPLKAIREVMKSENPTWQDLHTALQKHGLAIHQGKKGGYTISDKDGAVHVRASDAFREWFSGKEKRADLERRFGAFEEPKERHAPSQGIYLKERSKRDPAAREAAREKRAMDRKALKDDFKRYKQQFKAASVGLDKTEVARRRQAITDYFKAEREKVKGSGLDANQRKALYSVLAMDLVKARAQLTADLAEERKRIKDVNRPQTFREWTADRAEEGNQAAIAQLRGWAYADKRQGKRLELEEAELQKQNCIVYSRPADPVAKAQILAGITYRVNRGNGAVTYLLRSRDAFTDHGRLIHMSATGAGDPESIKAALLLAKQKFGATLTINGSPEFRKLVIAAMKDDPALQDVRFADPMLERERQKAMVKGKEAKPIPSPSPSSSSVPAPARPPERPQASTVQDVATSHELAAIWIKDQGKHLDVKDANTGSGVYRGEILHETTHHLVQDVGRGAVIHRKADLEGAHQVGTRVAIRYQGGRGAVQTLPPVQRPTGRGGRV